MATTPTPTPKPATPSTPSTPSTSPYPPPEGHATGNPGPGEPGGPAVGAPDPSMKSAADEQRERSDAGNPIKDERHGGPQKQVPGVSPTSKDAS